MGGKIVNYCNSTATMIRAVTHASEAYNCPCNLFEVSWVPTFLFLCIALNFSLVLFPSKSAGICCEFFLKLLLERYQVVSDSLRGKTAVAPCPQLLSGARLEMFPIGLWHISHFHCLNQKKLLISTFLLMPFLMTVVTTLTLFVICKRL